MTDEDFISLFSGYGKMKEVILMKDNNNPSNNRGFGFVTPEEVAVADQILLEPKHTLDGRDLDIKRALPKNIDDPLIHTRTNRIFLGGISQSTTEEDITAFFNDRYGSFGAVKEIVIKKERQSGRPRGFCFISFENSHVVDKIMIEMRYPVINGKRCEVKKADPGVPITGAPPSQLQAYGQRESYSQQNSYQPQRAPYNRGPAPVRDNQGPPNSGYEYGSYGASNGMVGYPQSNAYFGYYQNQSVSSQYPSQGGQGYPQYGYQDQRGMRFNYHRPQNAGNSSRGAPY